MTLFDKTARERIAAAVTEIERHTDAEVVTVVAASADDYRWIGLFWAALVALIGPGIVAFFVGGLDGRTLLLTQWLVFVIAGLVFRNHRIAPRLVPKRLRHERAALLARQQFLAQNLHRTDDATGMLIFVAEAEHYVEILVDHGIAQRIDDSVFAGLIATFTQRVAKNETAEGFIECIQACGTHLARAVPATHERNELSDRLVVLD